MAQHQQKLSITPMSCLLRISPQPDAVEVDVKQLQTVRAEETLM